MGSASETVAAVGSDSDGKRKTNKGLTEELAGPMVGLGLRMSLLEDLVESRTQVEDLVERLDHWVVAVVVVRMVPGYVPDRCNRRETSPAPY